MPTQFYAGPSEDSDRYILTEMRSRGGEGELWVGWVTVDGQQLLVAVKAYHPSPSLATSELFERARGQAEILRSIEHPNLIKVREVFIGPAIHELGMADPSTSVVYVVMNWANGENLNSWVARNPTRDLLASVRLISGLAAGIDELHSGRRTGGIPVLHRDIKPANVIVGEDGVRLVDFGLARFASSDFATVAGSAAYLAPEVFAGSPPSAASDRFGFGATAYFLVCGVNPNHANPAEMRARLLQVPGIVDQSGFADHMMAMMHPDPARRPTACIEWAEGLAIGTVTSNFSRQTSGPPGGPPIDPQGVLVPNAPAPKNRRGLLVGVIIGVIALIGAGVAAIALTSGNDESAGSSESTTTVEATTSSSAKASTTTSSTSTSTTSSTSSTSSTTTTLPDSPGGLIAPTATQYLADFSPVDNAGGNYSGGLGNLSGVAYTRSVMVNVSGNDLTFVEYDLGRKFARLKGSAGPLDDVPSDTVFKIQIYGDGASLFDQTIKLGAVGTIDADLTNVLRLRIQVTNLAKPTCCSAIQAIFGDLSLTPPT